MYFPDQQNIGAKVAVIVIALLCGGCFESEVDKLVDQIEQSTAALSSNSAHWQDTLSSLEAKLRQDNNATANSALAQLQTITAESVQLAGQEAQCRADQVAAHAKAALQQLVHTLKKDGRTESFPIAICTISPKTIDLSKNPKHISISGDYLYGQPKPHVALEDEAGNVIPLTSDLVSRQTGYEMTIDLTEIQKKGLLTKSVRKMLITSPPSSELHEIPVEPLEACDDGIRNQDETDVDCGGNSCNKCAAKKVCKIDSDCDGNACISGKCGLHSLGGQVVRVDFGGGQGGDHSDQSSCPTGTLAIGFYAKTGQSFDQLALFCSTLQTNGTIAPTSVESRIIGGGGGDVVHQSVCPNGEVLVGITGRSGWYLDVLQGECKLPGAVALQASAAIDRSPEVNPSPGGGAPTEGHCASGFAVVNFAIREGTKIDHLWMDCTDVKRIPAQ